MSPRVRAQSCFSCCCKAAINLHTTWVLVYCWLPAAHRTAHTDSSMRSRRWVHSCCSSAGGCQTLLSSNSSTLTSLQLGPPPAGSTPHTLQPLPRPAHTWAQNEHVRQRLELMPGRQRRRLTTCCCLAPLLLLLLPAGVGAAATDMPLLGCRALLLIREPHAGADATATPATTLLQALTRLLLPQLPCVAPCSSAAAPSASEQHSPGFFFFFQSGQVTLSGVKQQTSTPRKVRQEDGTTWQAPPHEIRLCPPPSHGYASGTLRCSLQNRSQGPTTHLLTAC